jgi:hypothetical protein
MVEVGDGEKNRLDYTLGWLRRETMEIVSSIAEDQIRLSCRFHLYRSAWKPVKQMSALIIRV